MNPAVDAGFRLLSFGVARAVSLPTGAAWRRGVCRFRGSACRGAPGLALRRQGHRGAPSVLDFFSGVRWSPSLNHALGAGFSLCQLHRSSLLGKPLLSEDKCYEPFSHSPGVLTESGSKLGEDSVQLVSAWGGESLVAEFADSIVQSPRQHAHGSSLSMDRRNARYLTHCIS